MSEEQRRIKVLHVDDEPDFLALTKAFLVRENVGFSIDTATSAENGLELLKSGKYDVVVSDYKMPVMDGLEFLKTLRASGNMIPFVMFTGKGREEVAIEALNRGANGYLQKGEDIKSMYGTLAHVIRAELKKTRADVALRESEEKYRVLIENANEAILVAQEGMLKFVNPKVMELTGYTKEELISRPFVGFIHPDDREMVAERHFERLEGEAHPSVYPFRIIDKEGNIKWTEINVALITWEGRPAALCFLSDITKRKAVADALRESETRYESLYSMVRLMCDNVPDMIWAKDLEKKFIFANRAICEQLLNAKDTDEPIGKTDIYFAGRERRTHPDNPRWHDFGEICTDSDSVVMKSRKAERFDEFGNVKGEFLFLDVHKAPFWDEQEKMIGTVGCGRIVTKEKQIEEECKQAEDALRESEERYRAIVEDQTELICRFQPDLTLTFVNDAYCQYFSKKREELIGHSFIPLIPDEDQKIVHEQLSSLTIENPIGAYEHRVLAANGAIRWQQWTDRAIFGDQSSIIEFQSVGRDITERKKVEAELRESEERFRAIFETAQDSVFIKDRTLKYTQVNPAMERLFALPASKLIGRTDEDLFPGEAASHIMEKDSRVLDGEIIEEEHIKSVKGIQKTFHIIKVPMHDSSGEVIGLCGIARDITERKRAEEKLAKIVDSVNIPAFAINSEHKISHWNTAVESLTGVKREEVIGSDKQWIAFYATKRPVMADLIIDEAPKSKFKDWYGDKYKKSALIEGAYVASDFFPALGEEGKWLLFTAAPLRDSEGTVIGAIETLQDISERKRAEDALKESEEKYHNLVERANDGITIIQDNIVKYLNSRLAEMWGVTVEEVVGTPFTDYIPPDELPKVVDRYKRRMTGEDVTPIYETVLRHKDGRDIYAELNAGTITFQGKPADLVFIRDITERKVAEKAIMESEEEYCSLVESTEDSVYLVDRDCRYLFMNEKHLSRIGMPKDQVIGKTYGELHSEEETEEFAEIVERVFKTGKSASQEHISHWGNRYVLRTLSPVKDSEGGVTAVTVVSKDISERREAEEEIRKLSQYQESIIDNANIWLDVLDEKANVVIWNKAAEVISGYTREEVVGHGKIWEWLYPDEAYRKEITEKAAAIIMGDAVEDLETTIRRKDGQLRIISWHSRNLTDEKGAPIGSIALGRDITERKQVKQEREQLLKELEAKNTELERFTYTVSHDLRSPLVTIQGFTDMVQNDLERNELEKAKDNLTFIENAATKMEKLLSDTLELSRIGRMVNPPEDVPFGVIVQEALEQTVEQMKSSGVEVSVADDFPTVHVDRMRIAEVLVNLIMNSINYRGDQPSPKIEIRHRIDNGESVFFLRDNGIGIDPSQHEKVFDLFYQVDMSGKGTGAGLAIVKRIIKVHNGRIWIESEKGKGCTVCFTLPVK